MCDVDVDVEGPDVWSARWVRARVAHRCSGCAGYTIQPGDLYWSCRAIWDGVFGGAKHCGSCHAVYEFLCEANPDPVDITLDCGETLDDPDDPAHALAFWTREDGQRFAEWRKYMDGGVKYA